MADATLAAVSSAPTALIQPTPAEGAAPAAGMQSADPFAELMATVAAAGPAGTIAVSIKAPPGLPPARVAVAADTLPRDDANPATGAKDRSGDETEAKDGSGDPLADAIATGPTAVLAIAPEIVPPPPVAPQPPAPVAPAASPRAAVPAIKIDGSNGGIRPLPRADTRLPSTRPNEAAPATAGVPDARSASQAAPERADGGQTERQPARTAPALPAMVMSPPAPDSRQPDRLAAAIATLPPPAAAPAALTAPPPPAAAAAAEPTAPIQQAAANPAAPQPPSLRGPAPIRPDKDTRLSHAVDETRRRPDAVTADSVPAGLAGRVDDRPAPAFAAAAVVPKSDPIVQQTLSIARDGAWLDTLARDIASAANGGSDLHFRLEPPNLGSLTVAIAQSGDGASIRMTADTDATRTILLDAQPRLIADARAHGLKVADTHVDLGNQNQNGGQDASRWAQGNQNPNAAAQHGQNRQSSPAHQPFVSNLGRKSDAEPESPSRDSDALYA